MANADQRPCSQLVASQTWIPHQFGGGRTAWRGGRSIWSAGSRASENRRLLAHLLQRLPLEAFWPDGERAPLGSAIIIGCEDDAADTIRPRLEAAGADLSKVHLFDWALVSDRKENRNGGILTSGNIKQRLLNSSRRSAMWCSSSSTR